MVSATDTGPEQRPEPGPGQQAELNIFESIRELHDLLESVVTQTEQRQARLDKFDLRMRKIEGHLADAIGRDGGVETRLCNLESALGDLEEWKRLEKERVQCDIAETDRAPAAMAVRRPLLRGAAISARVDGALHRVTKIESRLEANEFLRTDEHRLARLASDQVSLSARLQGRVEEVESRVDRTLKGLDIWKEKIGEATDRCVKSSERVEELSIEEGINTRTKFKAVEEMAAQARQEGRENLLGLRSLRERIVALEAAPVQSTVLETEERADCPAYGFEAYSEPWAITADWRHGKDGAHGRIGSLLKGLAAEAIRGNLDTVMVTYRGSWHLGPRWTTQVISSVPENEALNASSRAHVALAGAVARQECES